MVYQGEDPDGKALSDFSRNPRRGESLRIPTKVHTGMKLDLKRPICFFDLETTGTNIAQDRIVEIAVLKVYPNGNKESRSWLVNPGMPIPEAATAIHGISDEKVAGEPSFKEISRDIQQMIQGCDLAGFNSNRFDIPLLAEHFLETEQPVVAVLLESDQAPTNVPEGYLKLHLLSHRLVKPHGTDLTGLFGILPNVAWTSDGPVDIAELPERQLSARLRGEVLEVSCVDKFPKMTDYVMPRGVRIADTARVRLGAYVGEGTTVMHEGFINFNAGCAGPNMIEGRVSAGVFIGEGSDLGGSSSTMGTLSGGGETLISIGTNCLIGANAGVGIGANHHSGIKAHIYGRVLRVLEPMVS